MQYSIVLPAQPSPLMVSFKEAVGRSSGRTRKALYDLKSTGVKPQDTLSTYEDRVKQKLTPFLYDPLSALADELKVNLIELRSLANSVRYRFGQH